MSKTEADRVLAEYERRARDIPAEYYSLAQPVNFFFHQQRSRVLLEALAREGMMPLDGKKILDVGCGTGQHLVDLESWGARREDLAGIDLIESRVLQAKARLFIPPTKSGSGADLRVGDATSLPWPDEEFDLVSQSTVFTSIKDDATKREVAAEMLRVLKPSGVIIWYDFFCNNPKNQNVKGIRPFEIRLLFSGASVKLKTITLAPPIARRLVPVTWTAALLLEKMSFLNSHYLGIIRKRAAT